MEEDDRYWAQKRYLQRLQDIVEGTDEDAEWMATQEWKDVADDAVEYYNRVAAKYNFCPGCLDKIDSEHPDDCKKCAMYGVKLQ